MNSDAKGGGRSILIVALGLVFTAQSAPAQQAADAPEAGVGQLDEIVVTAEKRVSTVLDTPISLTAISGDTLQAQGVGDLIGVMSEVPGISMRYAGPGQTELEMRGLASSGGASPTVGFYLDEIPLTAPANAQVGKVVIDPSLFDLNRVEVLRGPQGTLYGSGSMGGTVKLVTNQPNLQKVEGNIDVVVSDTPAGGVNPGANIMINMPLVDDVLALRVVGTEQYTHGWIDRDVVADFPYPVTPCATWGTVGCTRGNVLASPVTQVNKDVNWEVLTGGRATLLYKPTDTLSISTFAMYQGIRMGGYNSYDQSTGTGYEAHYQPDDLAEPFQDSFELVGLTINDNLGFADLTSATSYWRRAEQQTMDTTEAIESLFDLFFGVQQFVPNGYTEKDESNQFSQELRLASAGDSRLQWVGGVFYSKFESIYQINNVASGLANLSTGGAAANPTGILYDAYNPFHVNQYAVFGEGSYKFADSWKLTTGVRWYDFQTNVDEWQNGIGTATGNASATVESFNTSANGFNPKVNLSYELDHDLNVYVSASKGFRPGGVNLPIPSNLGCTLTQETYKPDSIWDYEIGEKANFFDRRLSVNSDVFYIDWNDVQQEVNQGCGYPLTANAGKARSYGTEIEVSALLTSALTLSVSGTYTNAKLTEVNPTLSAADSALVAGSPILDIPKYTESTSLTYVRPISTGYDFTAKLNNSFVGPSTDISYTYINLPSHDIVNLRLGVVGHPWATYLFVNNLADKRAALGTDTTAFSWLVPSLVRVSTNQPRTIGIDVNYRF